MNFSVHHSTQSDANVSTRVSIGFVVVGLTGWLAVSYGWFLHCPVTVLDLERPHKIDPVFICQLDVLGFFMYFLAAMSLSGAGLYRKLSVRSRYFYLIAVFAPFISLLLYPYYCSVRLSANAL